MGHASPGRDLQRLFGLREKVDAVERPAPRPPSFLRVVGPKRTEEVGGTPDYPPPPSPEVGGRPPPLSLEPLPPSLGWCGAEAKRLRKDPMGAKHA